MRAGWERSLRRLEGTIEGRCVVDGVVQHGQQDGSWAVVIRAEVGDGGEVGTGGSGVPKGRAQHGRAVQVVGGTWGVRQEGWLGREGGALGPGGVGEVGRVHSGHMGASHVVLGRRWNSVVVSSRRRAEGVKGTLALVLSVACTEQAVHCRVQGGGKGPEGVRQVRTQDVTVAWVEGTADPTAGHAAGGP